MVEAMQQDSSISLATLKTDGGMVTNHLLMQFQADILNVAETTALGAAYAAGLAMGYWNSIEELQQFWGVEMIWHPDMPAEGRTLYYRPCSAPSPGWMRIRRFCQYPRCRI
jgi:glycerol kinase